MPVLQISTPSTGLDDTTLERLHRLFLQAHAGRVGAAGEADAE